MRLLFALLIACLSLPAMAAHPCAPVAPAHASVHKASHHAPEQHSTPRVHECIGCIAPIDGLTRLAAPVAMPPRQRVAYNDQPLAPTRNCPSTPPPKPLA